MYRPINEETYAFRGSNADTKPIGKGCNNANVDYEISVGSTFFEIETSKTFMYKIEETTVGETTTKTGSWSEIQLGSSGLYTITLDI